MPAFVDCCCPRCGHCYGFYGELTDNPGCSQCGWKPDQKTLKETQQRMVQSRGWRATPHAFEPSPARKKFCTKCGGMEMYEPHPHFSRLQATFERWYARKYKTDIELLTAMREGQSYVEPGVGMSFAGWLAGRASTKDLPLENNEKS
jgi:hypothetical protein